MVFAWAIRFREIKLRNSLEPEVYWKKVFKLNNSLGENFFPTLQKVINFTFILQFSNATAERIFSRLYKCKTYLRNKLSSDTVAAVLHTKEGIQRNGSDHFEPSQDMYNKNWRL